jgi:hypothetical protein
MFALGLLSKFGMGLIHGDANTRQLHNGYTGSGADLAFALCSLTALLAGELAERYLFFTACVPPRMPGA